MFRYKREEVKIQAWENHEKRKAEMQMKKMEVICFIAIPGLLLSSVRIKGGML